MRFSVFFLIDRLCFAVYYLNVGVLLSQDLSFSLSQKYAAEYKNVKLYMRKKAYVEITIDALELVFL